MNEIRTPGFQSSVSGFELSGVRAQRERETDRDRKRQGEGWGGVEREKWNLLHKRATEDVGVEGAQDPPESDALFFFSFTLKPRVE